MIYITISKSSFIVFDNKVFDNGQSGCNICFERMVVEQ